MAEIVGDGTERIYDEEVAYRSAVSEATFAKMGGLSNYIADHALFAPLNDYNTEHTLTTPATYTWTCPDGVYQALITAYGSGGAGGLGTADGGGGGGGAGAGANFILKTVPTTVYTFIVPAGGVTGNGANFVLSDSSTILTCSGGAVGSNGGVPTGGSGGAGGAGGAVSISQVDKIYQLCNWSDGATGYGYNLGGSSGGASLFDRDQFTWASGGGGSPANQAGAGGGGYLAGTTGSGSTRGVGGDGGFTIRYRLLSPATDNTPS